MYIFANSTTSCELHAVTTDNCLILWRGSTSDETCYCLEALWTLTGLVGCLEPGLRSCLHHSWIVTTELSHKLLHDCSTWRTSIRCPLGAATNKWTQISLQLAKHLLSLSLRHSLEVAQFQISLLCLLFCSLIFKHANRCLPISS